jgi:hypothetical protein
MIQLTQLGTAVSGTAEDLDGLRKHFHQQHCIRLRNLLEPQLLGLIMQQIEQSEFYERTHPTAGQPPSFDMCMTDNAASQALQLVVNDRKFLRFVEQATGCGGIRSFFGSVYRLTPGLSHYDAWHSDMTADRMLALSINLSTDVYRGGILQIRHLESGQIVHEVANTGPGDGILFRIAPYLKHRVSPVEGTVARTAFAGWFYAQPEYHDWLKQRLSATGREQSGSSV